MKAFPQLKIDSVTESQIKGLYEVVAGQNVFYFYPEKDLLLVGDMYTPVGQGNLRNITGEKKLELKKKAQQQFKRAAIEIELARKLEPSNPMYRQDVKQLVGRE